MMNTKITLDKEEVRRFVGDFNKPFKDLEEWKSNAVQIESWKEHFLEEYPNIFNVSTENEVEMETTMETESRPIVDREEKLRKVEERLLSNRTNERFTNYDGVMSNDSLSLSQKIIHLQKAIDDATRRKIHCASLQGGLFENAFRQSREAYKKTLKETGFSRQWAEFLRNLQKLALEYNQIIYCTVPLCYIRSNFKIIKEICERDKERWK